MGIGYRAGMAATITAVQKDLLKRLLKSGRWHNYSEIIRHGLELVRQEVEREDLAPFAAAVLAEAYRQASQEEREVDRELGRASARPRRGERD